GRAIRRALGSSAGAADARNRVQPLSAARRGAFPRKHDRLNQLNRRRGFAAAISFSQGAAWNTLISTYIGAMPLSGDERGMPPHSVSIEPSKAVSSAIAAKLGAAAKCSHAAMLP